MPPEVIVHHLRQAKAALAAADDAGVEIQLRSAPGAAASAGVDYLRALGEAAGHELLIDCDDDAGLVMAALRAGCRKLMFSGPDDVRRRLHGMAGKLDATLREPAGRPPPCLVLMPDDDMTTVRPWLDAQSDA